MKILVTGGAGFVGSNLIKKLKEVHNNNYDYIIEKETYYATDKIKIINKLTNDEFYYRVDLKEK